MASRPFQFLEKKRSKIRKRAAKHFERLAALSTHSAGRRTAVKTGCKPVHFSLDGCPLSCYFSGSVATTSGTLCPQVRAYNTLHFASQSRVPNGGVAPFGNPHKKKRYATPPRGAYRLFLLSSPPAVSVEQKSAWIGVVSLSK